MKPRLKRLSEQTIVITGASSGIGLVTARMAAQRGARLVLTARSGEALQKLVDEINTASPGGVKRAIAVPGDVASEEDVRRVAEAAVAEFGGIDTWVNNAGVSVYGRIEQVKMEDHRRLFETNFWGTVIGSRVACEYLLRGGAASGAGGALINVGSVLSDRAIPLQGMYCASKHAVKGFTDSLRMELEEEGAPVSVTLIKPSAIDTPYVRHAKNYMEVEPINPPPVYAPETVAEAILHCAQHPERDVTIGGGGRMLAALGQHAPRLTDRYMETTMFSQQRTDRPSGQHPGTGGNGSSLHRPSNDLAERGGYPGHVAESSLYTKAALHPLVTTAAVVGAALAVAGALLAAGGRRRGRRRVGDRLRSLVPAGW